MRLQKFLLPEIPAQLPGEVPEGGVAKRKPIVATKLLKLQGSQERENNNCGNQIAENLGRNLIVILAMKLPKIRRKKRRFRLKIGGKKKELWQLICGNGIAEMGGKKKLCQLICGNVVAKMEGKKKCDNWLCFLELPKWEGKKRMMVMKLLKIGGERERERERENCLDKKYIYLEESITSPLPPDSYSPSTSKYIL